MSEFKGTPGPWIMRSRLMGSVGTEQKLVHICMEPTSPEYGMDEEDEANANLIAAAPDLLEACLRMRNQLKAAGYEAEKDSLNPTKCLLAQVEAAISKALGQ